MDVNQLCTVLQLCLSPDEQQRRAAEHTLKECEPSSGHATRLLSVAAEGSIDLAVRQVAAITVKNLVKRRWEASEDSGEVATTFILSDPDKQFIRDNVLETLIRAPHLIQTQIGEVLKNVLYCDYPDKWPGLLHGIYSNMVSQEQTRVHGALLAMRILARKYEYKDKEESGPFTEVINTIFPVLLTIFKQLVAMPSPAVEIAEYIKLVCKIFWSSTFMGIPDILLTKDHADGWISTLLVLVTRPVPAEVMAGDPSEWPANPWWKAKKWVLHITHRLIKRYGIAKQAKEGNDKAFAKMLVSTYGRPLLDAHVALAAAVASGQYLSPRCTNLVLEFLTCAALIKSCYTALEGQWDAMVRDLALPLMSFNDEDAELWEEDPAEYIRRGYDILEDMYSPKTGAANLLHELCSRPKSRHLDVLMATLAGVLHAHSAALASGAPVAVDVARRMDGALLAIGTLLDVLQQMEKYSNELATLLTGHVLPCFGSAHGHLRAKAAWLCGVLSGHDFSGEGAGQGPLFLSMVEAVIARLSDPDMPVKVDSVVSLRHLIDDIEDPAPLRPLLPHLLSTIFQLMDTVDAEELVFTLESIVSKFEEDIGPYAVTMCGNLVTAYFRYTAETDEEDEDDAAALAAYGCLRAINTLLESCSSLTHLYDKLEAICYPILQRDISTSGQDVIEDVLEMMGYFTFYSPTISDRMWSLWPQLHTALTEWAIDYWENILIPLDNLISRDTPRFLASTDPDYQASAYAMVEASLKGDYQDGDVVFATKLVEVILQNCRGCVDRWLSPYLSLVFERLMRTEKRQLKDQLVVVVANALYYNPALTLQVMEALGTTSAFFGTWMTMVFAKRPSESPQHFRRVYDKKLCVLGLSSLLHLPPGALPPGVLAGLGQVLNGILSLLVSLKAQEERIEKEKVEAAKAAAEEEEEEEEDGTALEEDKDDDDDEEDDPAGDAYMKRLEKEARTLMGLSNEDSDDDFSDDDEESDMPVDKLDPYVFFTEALAAVEQAQDGRFAAIAGAMTEQVAAAVHGMMAYAREKQAQALAAPAPAQQ